MTRSILHPAPISTRQLTWYPESRTFVGEISSTNGFGRVYADACDEGLTLVSATTGREVVFAVTRTIRDAEGDVVEWVLENVNRDWLNNATIRLFND